MIKGETKSGIKFSIDERIKNDTRFVQYIVEMQNEDDQISTSALYDLLNFVLGSRKNSIAFQNEVAKANDGICNSDILVSELSDIFKALNAKKS